MRTLEDSKGNKSNSRTLSWPIIIMALLMALLLVLKAEDVLAGAAAAGVVFTTIAGPTMAWLYKQKQVEERMDV